LLLSLLQVVLIITGNLERRRIKSDTAIGTRYTTHSIDITAIIRRGHGVVIDPRFWLLHSADDRDSAQDIVFEHDVSIDAVVI
jgi:hypothetical protein